MRFVYTSMTSIIRLGGEFRMECVTVEFGCEVGSSFEGLFVMLIVWAMIECYCGMILVWFGIILGELCA